MKKPLKIAVLCDDKLLEPHHFHCVGEKYIRAVSEGMEAIALLVPVLAEGLEVKAVLDIFDGLLLPGAYSNIDPVHYGQENEQLDSQRDPARDASAFAIIREAVDMGLPTLAICRGFQEVNVALGGSLYQRVQAQAHLLDHRENNQLSLSQQYADVHSVRLTPGGKLASLSDKSSVMVNSLHQQGICTLADGLRVEAVAEDGLVEAYSLQCDRKFLLAVQWHPEWQLEKNPFNKSMFDLFKHACLEFQKK